MTHGSSDYKITHKPQVILLYHRNSHKFSEIKLYHNNQLFYSTCYFRHMTLTDDSSTSYLIMERPNAPQAHIDSITWHNGFAYMIAQELLDKSH